MDKNERRVRFLELHPRHIERAPTKRERYEQACFRYRLSQDTAFRAFVEGIRSAAQTPLASRPRSRALV